MWPEAILFDFGDTLASLNPAKERILQQYLGGKGIKVSQKAVRDAYRIVEYHYKQSAVSIRNENQHREYIVNLNYELLKAMGLSLNGTKWSFEIHQYFSSRKKWALFADAAPTLRKIKKMNIRIAILANWNIRLHMLVEEVGVATFFERIYSSAELGMEKPDPRIFRHVLRTMRLVPHRTIYVGNEYETDIIGARKAGLVPVLVDRLNLLPQADCVRIKNLMGLIPWISAGKIS